MRALELAVDPRLRDPDLRCEKVNPTISESFDMPGLQLAQETVPPRETEHTNDLIARIKAKMRTDYPAGIMRRDAHPKMHGAVMAEFIVEPDLPAEFRIGVFKEPKTYRAWIRFSNGAGSIKPDSCRDIRGMAIKLMGVPGKKLLSQEQDETTHDFILATANVFFIKDMREMDAAAKAITGSLFAKIRFGLTHLRVGWLFLKTNLKCANPLKVRYFSTTPYLFGADCAVKYAATPLFKTPDPLPGAPSDDYLRLALAGHLKHGEARFDFSLQFQTDPDAMPIEHAGREWRESVSPFRKVATIRIFKQDCDNDKQVQFGENLSFTPWHALPEHRPLGGINRGRKLVYEAISAFRHQYNGVARREPDSWDI